ncbi:hypothetical protein BER93_00360 [Xanthomonas fragariae]|nr:hypothetical protein BER92_00355 [Xanthomonas fragariae]AOD16870.1 hypothetical protein BER93_00360 [Xanthomonas fragariae]
MCQCYGHIRAASLSLELLSITCQLVLGEPVFQATLFLLLKPSAKTNQKKRIFFCGVDVAPALLGTV